MNNIYYIGFLKNEKFEAEKFFRNELPYGSN